MASGAFNDIRHVFMVFATFHCIRYIFWFPKWFMVVFDTTFYGGVRHHVLWWRSTPRFMMAFATFYGGIRHVS
jgi:hypothetical protein